MNEKQRQVWTTQDLATAAGLARAYVRQLLIEGVELTGWKEGRDWRVSDAEARRWLASRGIE